MGHLLPQLAVLPSGRHVRLTKCVDPARPWELLECDGLFVLVRPHRGDKSRTEIFSADRVGALPFERVDAEALRELLNSNTRRPKGMGKAYVRQG